MPLLIGAVFALVPTPASASCDASLLIRSRSLTFQTFGNYPVLVTEDSAGKSQFETDFAAMWDDLATGLATALACQRGLERDAQLASRLASVTVTTRANLRLEGAAPPKALTRPMQGPGPDFEVWPGDSALVDSLDSLVHRAGADSIAELYSVLLNSFARGSKADSLPANLTVPGEEDAEDERDSTLVVDITYLDCFDSPRRARLFMLPPELTADRKVWLLSGLYYVRQDAVRSISELSREWGYKGKVVKLRATGAVLQHAFPRVE